MDYLYHLIVISLIYAILAISLNLLLGYTGLMSMGHAAFFALGAYASALLVKELGLSILLGMFIGIGLAAVMSIVVAVPALRIKDEYLVVLTLGFQMVVYGFAISSLGFTGGSSGIPLIPRMNVFGLQFRTTASYVPLIAIVFALCFAVIYRVTRSPFGRVLKAIRDDESAARMLGKDILTFKIWAFVIAGMTAAIAGSLYAHYTTYISPAAFSVNQSVFIVSLVIIGGSANLWGSLLAAFLMIMLPEALTFLPGADVVAISAIRVILYGTALILFIAFRPQGLLPEHAFRRRRREEEGHTGKPAKLEMNALIRAIMTSTGESLATREGQPFLEVRELTKRFGGINAANAVSFKVFPGTVTALIGPNGAGKTTVFNLITGFLRADGGQVQVKGVDVSGKPPHEISRMGLGRSFQEVRVFGRLSVLDNVLLACPSQMGESVAEVLFHPRKVAEEESENEDRAMACLRFVGLANQAGDLAQDISFAEQKLLVLAGMLAMGSDVLLIDELVSGIDPTSIGDVMMLVKRLAEEGKAILIIEHNLDVVKDVADSAHFLAEGKLISTGLPTDLMQDPALVELYFAS